MDIAASAIQPWPMKRLKSQAYYWTPEWQRGEREAEEDFRRGNTVTFGSAEEVIAWLRREND